MQDLKYYTGTYYTLMDVIKDKRVNGIGNRIGNASRVGSNNGKV
jgi:hypothetical protein